MLQNINIVKLHFVMSFYGVYLFHYIIMSFSNSKNV